MRRREGFTLTLPPRDGATAFRWLCSSLRTAILDGRLRPGTRLPATRALASQSGLSRGTIVAAFEQMKSEGYIAARSGSGTYVNSVLPDSLMEVAREPRAPLRARPPRRLSNLARRTQGFRPSTGGRARAFRANQPALDLFPTTLWAQVAGRALRRASIDQLRGCDPLGDEPLRKAVADYLYRARGVSCTFDQVVIVSGVQEALDLVARLVLNPGDTVAIENPCYTGAARAFESHGARLVSVPLDGEGMALPGAAHRRARLIYVTPAHQFPVGVSMSLPRRLALLEWAQQTGALIVEDDYDSEFRFAGPPVPALQGLDRHGVVLFAGSFSKVLFPSIRLGYLVVPSDLVDRVSIVKSVANRFAPVLEQATLCEFLTEGHFGRHVRRMREIYAGRLGVLLEEGRKTLAGAIEISPIEAGLQTVGWLRRGTTGVAAAAAAHERGVEVIPVSRYCREPLAREGLVLGFAAVDAREIARGVGALGAALGQERRRRTPSR